MGEVCLEDNKIGRMGFRHVQMTKIRPSDAGGGKTIPTVAQFGYDRTNLKVIREMSA